MDKNIGFFLGTNSRGGFVSLFNNIASEQGGRRTYIIKSGPGCGKSTLMRALARIWSEREPVEHIYCSSDPGSLDGIIQGGLAVLDGTAPHVLDPDFVGAGGGYITLPQFSDLPALQSKLGELRSLSARAKTYHEQSVRLISAAAVLEENIRAALSAHVPEQKLRRRARGIASRELKRRGGDGELRTRFIDAITPHGALRHYDTVSCMAKKIYVFADSYGLALPMLEEIRDTALESGYTVYACLCPLDPARVLHVIIPELELAFVTSDSRAQYGGTPHRHIRIDAYVPPDVMRKLRGKIRLTQKISRSLIDDAVDEVKSAHLLHDSIESLYRPHIDAQALDRLPLELAEALGTSL